MLKVSKFGGSSLSDSERFSSVARIVQSDIARRVVVVSAPGKRHASDHKITDLLYLCHAHTLYGIPCWDIFRRIRERFVQILDECSLHLPIERDLDEIYAALRPGVSRDYLASRGEYLSAKLMAALLGFSFVDAGEWLKFDYNGQVLTAESYAALQSLADGRKIVTPGFYGTLPSGAIHTFSRGGSDVTGSLAAAALHADLCENWTDVAGVLAADPRLVPDAAPIAHLTYDELQTLSDVGMQVLHESAVEPLRAQNIPLLIRSTHEPDSPGTLIRCSDCGGKSGAIAFAGVRGVSMLRLCHRGEDAAVLIPSVCEILKAEGLSVFHCASALGKTTLLIRAGASERLHAACENIRPLAEVSLRENLAVLAAVHRGTDAVPQVLSAVEGAGVPVHHLAETTPCLLMLVNDSQYETALKAACRVI
ncbi:MAG: aspartate kinase [Oscillospiraceae bacterium]|nr:aspartate kinase [Oscillospiraceae bacterium]